MDLPMQPSADLVTKTIQVGNYLSQQSISHALTGGLALAFWGYTRSTIDVDIIVAVSQENFDQLRSGANTPFIMQPDELTMPHMKIVRGLTSSAGADVVIIDLLIVESEWSSSIMQRRHQGSLRSQPIWVSSPEDIILLKLYSPRDKDREDIRMLMQLRKDRLDFAYIMDWSTRLGTLDRWLTLTSTDTPQSPVADS